MKMTFLRASIPLTKIFEKAADGQIIKHQFPKVFHLTSEEFEYKTLHDVYKILVEQATSKARPCLFRGELIAPLKNESRKSMGHKDALTELLLLDLDNAPFASHAEFMKAMGFDDVSYIWQWSSSAKMNAKAKTLNGHIFMLLDKAIQPSLIRAWLTHLNMNTEILRTHLHLSDGKQALKYPLDIVVNDNNRIIYVAEPIFKGVPNPFPKGEDRFEFVKKTNERLAVKRIGSYDIQILKKEVAEYINALREKAGLEKMRSKLKVIGEYEVQAGAGEVTNWQVFDCGDYYRYNLGDGQSKAYWHPKDNFEYLHNFKGEPSMLMKEVLPEQYKHLRGRMYDDLSTPTEKGHEILFFREKRTAEYWKGIWKPVEEVLDIHRVKTKDQIVDFLAEHNKPAPPFIPEVEFVFKPRSSVIVDKTAKTINRFVLPKWLRTKDGKPVAKAGPYPTIQKALDSAVGTGDVQEYFLNWLAVIVQQRIKTQTAWVLHGTQGTGKGILFSKVIAPLFEQYAGSVVSNTLNSNFLSFHENKLICFIDEVDVDMFEKTQGNGVEAALKNMITDDPETIHRKGVDAYSMPGHVNLIFGSNKNQPVKIPLNDRRYNVGVFQNTRWMPTSKEIDELLPKEVEHFAHYLMTRKACADKAREILQSEARKAIQALGTTSTDELANDILQGNLVKLAEHMPDEKLHNTHGIIDTSASIYAALIRRFAFEDQSNISRDELHAMFNYVIGDMGKQGPNKFTSFLRHRGIHTKKIWSQGSAAYGITIKWVITAEQRAELVASLQAAREPKLKKVKG